MGIKEQYKQAYRAMRLLKSWRVNMGNYDVMDIVAADQEVFKVMPKDMRVEAYYSYSHRHDFFKSNLWEDLNRALNGYKFPKGYAARKIARGNYSVYRPTLTGV